MKHSKEKALRCNTRPVECVGWQMVPLTTDHKSGSGGYCKEPKCNVRIHFRLGDRCHRFGREHKQTCWGLQNAQDQCSFVADYVISLSKTVDKFDNGVLTV